MTTINQLQQLKTTINHNNLAQQSKKTIKSQHQLHESNSKSNYNIKLQTLNHKKLLKLKQTTNEKLN